MPIKTFQTLMDPLIIDFTAADQTKVSDTETVSLSNFMGYITGIIRVNASANVEKIALGWRMLFDYVHDPGTEPGPGGYLPVYMIKQGYDPDVDPSTDPDDLSVGVPPDYLLLSNLTGGVLNSGADLEQSKLYYIFLSPPETPAALPLISDQDTTTHEIEFIAKAVSETADADLNIEIRLFYTEFPNT